LGSFSTNSLALKFGKVVPPPKRQVKGRDRSRDETGQGTGQIRRKVKEDKNGTGIAGAEV
jgi:hypothetical protein